MPRRPRLAFIYLIYLFINIYILDYLFVCLFLSPGWYYVTDRHTEYGMKSFSLPSLSASSITAHLPFYYKFYGYTTCSLFVYMGKSLRFNQRRSNSKDSAWRRTPNVNFCCCPRCPRVSHLLGKINIPGAAF